MQEENFPFEKLKLIGLTKEDFQNMPTDFQQSLINGEMTPMISVTVTLQNGNRMVMPLKLRSIVAENGKADIIVYPSYRDFKNQWNLPAESFEALKNGDVLHSDGRYIQRDAETNALIQVSEKDMNLEKKIADFEKLRDIELGIEQKNQIRNGRPVEVNAGGEMCTVGIDLHEKEHFRMLNGSLHDWEYNQKLIYDVLHPEYMGVVKTDENRWEYHQIVNNENFPEALNRKPKQAVSSGIKI